MRFFIETYGCTMNQGESRDLAQDLLSHGHEQVADEGDADLVIINTCVVIQPTELKIMKRLRRLSQTGQKVIIAGCLPSVKPDQMRHEFPDAVLLPPSDYPIFSEMVNELYGTCKTGGSLTVGQISGILPVSQGCLGNCSYCLTKKARGDLNSYPISNLKKKARQLLEDGARELLVTAQDTGCYGLDINTDLSELLKEIVALDGEFMVRLGMMNPDSLAQVLDQTVKVWNHPKVYKFLHLPVQSGSERVLKAMGRGYDVPTFESQVRHFRALKPLMSLSTDIITGFPGETEDDHRASVELMERVRPNIINVTRYSPRPGTPAAKAKGQVPSWISKERSREMAKLRFELGEAYYAGFVGQALEILITEVGKKGSLVGRSREYAPVAISERDARLGQWVEVEITGHAATHLLGKAI
ncbi:MAG: (Dimethylallyl)adenosine tRNA methylthiotransferase MiaB [Methanomassiliicoccales archaeon PtaU1.Bin124]|nr:MAG: (Dimethylallyl)adenosine tRNA methylthiotransferase MiaB [Methanomassiliicoccales archaeon PtaU1.Bin124]